VFYEQSIAGPSPIVGAVGMLQFDVLLHRLEHEYGVAARLDPLNFRHGRWVVGPAEAIDRVASGMGRVLVYDSKERPLILFDSEWALRTAVEKEKDLTFHDSAP
jgi:peptide chain release factor 3